MLKRLQLFLTNHSGREKTTAIRRWSFKNSLSMIFEKKKAIMQLIGKEVDTRETAFNYFSNVNETKSRYRYET